MGYTAVALQPGPQAKGRKSLTRKRKLTARPKCIDILAQVPQRLKLYKASVPTFVKRILQTAVHPAGVGRFETRAETLQRWTAQPTTQRDWKRPHSKNDLLKVSGHQTALDLIRNAKLPRRPEPILGAVTRWAATHAPRAILGIPCLALLSHLACCFYLRVAERL